MILFGNLDTLDEARVSIVKRVEFYMSYAPQFMDYRTSLEHFLARMPEEPMEDFIEA